MKKSSKRTLYFLNEVAGRTKWNILSLLLVQAILGISGICYALFLRDIINAAVAGEKQQFFNCVFLFIALVCLQMGFRAVVRFLEEQTRSDLENRLKDRLFTALLHKDYASVSAVHSGEWQNRLTSDTVVVANAMTEILPGVNGMLVKLVGAVAMIVLLEARFLYLIVPGGCLLIILSYAFRKVMKRLHKDVQEQDGRLRIFMQEMLGSMLVVRSFALEGNVSKDTKSKMKTHKQARMRRNHFSNLCNVGFGVIMNSAYVLGVFFCGYGILTQTMTYGTFMAVLQLIGQVQTPFANISGFLPRYYAMLASAERLMDAERLPEQDNPESKSLRKIQEIYTKCFESIGMENACFTYMPPVQELTADNGHKYKEQMSVVIQNLSLEIHKGEYVAFTGASGCGKSTVLKLLMCLYSLDSGQRYLLLGGERKILDGRWQKLFAYVPQGNYLMSGTIRQVVGFANQEKQYDEKYIREALTIACADTFVYELEQGVDTLLGERGLGLSEGQMQRLAIARAVFSAHPILLLDECTSALDEAMEKQLLNNLRLMTDKTVLIVTHRPAALDICDKVITFADNGFTNVTGTK